MGPGLEERPPRAGLRWLRVGCWLPPALLIALCWLGLALIYAWPAERAVDLGAGLYPVEGMHYPLMSTPSYTYIYGNGRTRLPLPQLGGGAFLLSVRLGGPDDDEPVRAWAGNGGADVSLGLAGPVRVYRLLLPPGSQGELRLALDSETRPLADDERQLGLRIDWLRARSVAGAPPPPALLATAALALLCAWLALSLLPVAGRERLAAAGLGAALILALAWLGRGRMHTHQLLGGLALAGLLALPLVRLDLARLRERVALPRIDPAAAPYVAIVGLVLLWRALLWAVGALGLWHSASLHDWSRFVTDAGALIGREEFARHVRMFGWVRWDCLHYVAIAEQGYTFHGERWPTIAFFPLYPALVRLAAPLALGRADVAAMLISNLALAAAACLLYALLSRDFGAALAQRALLLLLAFPTALYFFVGYSESVTLLCFVAALWFMRREQWWLAGLAGFFLSLAKLPGVSIAGVLLLAYGQSIGWRWRALRWSALAAALPLLGLGLFMLYQWWRFGTPLAFLEAQQLWQQQISTPWQMLAAWLDRWRNTTNYGMLLFQLGLWLLFALLTLLALWRLPLVYGLAALGFLLPSYLSNLTQSLPRYVLLAVPAFILLAQLLRRPLLLWASLSVSLLLLGAATMLYVNAYWVA